MRSRKATLPIIALAAAGFSPALAWAQAPDAVPPPPPSPPPAGFSSAPPPPPPGFAPPAQPLPSPTADTFADMTDWRQHRQGDVSGFMGWAFNVPFGSVRDFTAVVSPLGFEIQFNGWVLDNLSLGVSGEWATYVDNRARTTFSVEDSAITATAYNYMQTTAAHFLVHYFFPGGGPVRPYIGPHVGVSWSMFDLEAADLALSDSEFSINFGGETGVEIPFGRNAPVALANLRYSFAPAAEFRNIVSNVQSFGLLLGIGF
jgi:hypothetical protein